VGDPPPATLPPGWQPALPAVRAARVTLFIGESNAGKTTLLGLLARRCAREERVAVVDADLGQSEIGPPGTVALAHVRDVEAPLSAADVRALAFVGVTTPAQDVRGTITATGRMVARARREDFARVLVDTSGLVAGGLGRALKSAKIAATDADLVLCLQRGDECEHILGPYGAQARPRIVRLPALGSRRGRSAAERRLRRQRILAAYLSAARPVSLDLDAVVLRRPPLGRGAPLPAEGRADIAAVLGVPVAWAERHPDHVAIVTDAPVDEIGREEIERRLRVPVRVWATSELEGALAGLESADGETVGIGLVRRLDLERHRLDVLTTAPPGAIAAITIGRIRVETG
jgi:polynucleotide 5'-hydroxyl-kinase GRC3/NOL9